MSGPPTMARADSTRRQTPTFQRPISRPVSSRAFSGAGPPKPGGGGAVKYRPIAYDYATGSTFSVKINGKPVFLLNDFRKKVDANVKNAKYVTAFKKSLEQQVHDKKKQDAIRDQYEKAIVPRFRAVEHTDTGLTKNMLGLDADAGIDEPPAAQGEVGYSRIDQIDPWENSSGGGLEKYNPCVTSVFAPVQYQGLDDTHPQWQREPSSHLSLDFVYGYQGASCWDRSLFGEGPGMDNLHFLQSFNPSTSKMEHTGEVLYFAAATVIVFDIKNNIQRYFHHSDDVTAVTVLKRVVQRPDGSWEEAMSPPGAEAKEQWAKFFAYDKGRYIPNEQKWDPLSRLLPESSEEYPQFDDGILMDWRDWDLPNRCIVASGQRGRNPRVYVWRVVRHTGQNNLERQLLAQMTLGPKRLLVVSLSFNSKGNYLIALANDFEHHICVFDWKNKNGPQMIREGAAQSGLDSVDTCKFNPYSESAFASCGVKHLKLWEMGDDALAEAPGLFGDLGEPIDQRTVVFNPRGNAITGTRDGDLYVWSSGTVQAKYEKAHKENVIGLLFVDGIGLFSAGTGGMLKMWDPELRDTSHPICQVDLRAFALPGCPLLNSKSGGRAMDWTVSKDFLRYVNDDAEVEEDPAKGIRGAPATHISFSDIGATGCLMVGTTDNTVLLLGFRRVDSGDWTKGLSGDHLVQGESTNTTEGPLKEQDWWSHPDVLAVRNKATKYGCKKDNLPVAVYWYQKYEEDKPGYMPTGANSRGCPWTWAVCGKKVAMRGHQQSVDDVAVHPDERIFMSVAKDHTARFFDINDQNMIDCIYVYKPARSAIFWSKNGVNGVQADEIIGGGDKKCSLFTIGHEDGSFTVWHTDKTAAEAANQDDEDDQNPFYNPENAFGNIHLLCSNPLPRPAPPVAAGRKPSEQAFSVKYSPNGEFFAVALGDNCIDIYRHAIRLNESEPSRIVMKEHAKQKALGYNDEEIERQKALPYKRIGCCNDHSSAVMHVDFDVESLYMRTTSQSNELLYAFIPSGKQSLKTEELSKKKWESHNCVLGWTVKSIWARGSSANDINSVDRSNYKVAPWAPCNGGSQPSPYPYPDGVRPLGSADPVDVYKTNNFPGEGKLASWGHYVCATGDDSGKIKLFRWPAFGFKQAFRSYIGHGSHTMQVRFSYDDDYLISAGGSDMSLFQWRHVIPNKIYVQNLPDERDENGNFKCSNWELRSMLENFFSRFLKIDRGAEVRRKGDSNFEDRFTKAKAFLGGLSKKEQKRLLNIAYAHQDAWRGLSQEDEKYIPDREIVSVAIFNSGAAWEGQFFPSRKDGCQITCRWASIVFRSKDDVDDVIDLHGADETIRYAKLFEDQLVHLHPLYVETEEAGESDQEKDYDRKTPAINARRSKDRNPATGEKIVKKWEPVDDANTSLGIGYSAERKNGGQPHFLCITPYDPSESAIGTIVHNSMYKIFEEQKQDLLQEDVTWIKIKQLWHMEQHVWSQIQEWTMSDDDYGCGSSSEDKFQNFAMWKDEQDKKLAAGKDGKH